MVKYFISSVLAFFCVASLSATTLADDTTHAPNSNGLIVWLDASQPDTLKTDNNGRVVEWHSRSPAKVKARAAADSAPRLVGDAFGEGRPALRFEGQHWFDTDALAQGPGSLTIFIVFKRDADLAGGSRWQRLLSAHDGQSKNDTKGKSVFRDTNGTADAMRARIFTASLSGRHRGPLTLGRNQLSGNERLQGDIAEILIYDRGFLVDEQFADVQNYLAAKWGVVEDPRDDWTRARPLGETPERITDKLPLSDQNNEGNWKRYPKMTDAFDGKRLNAKKWHDHNPNWYGRVPALFLPSNVEVADGELHLTMRYDPDYPKVTQYRDSLYENYSSASVRSVEPVLYGYFEIESKAMDSAGSSAWWFSSSMRNAQGKTSRTEIDVFELGGKAIGHEYNYNMNAHIFETPEDGKNHWNKGGKWKAPFRFADDYHVFGLEWTPEHIKYYVNGVLVRRMPNTHWHTPQYMLFDSETMTNWLGWPEPEDLPSTFSIRYVRAWKNAGTYKPALEKPWRPHRTGETDVTRFIRQYEKDLGLD
ncbi:family 16 glycosylhydrolase [Algisphaera agarilytica]|uniref:Beta-glucanase (GH16 family) n=1 Tax=Algisphaera agarilytica TaxID=1385975 RepID=A0A7X0H6D5_9BACT|nr:family 16 glycosylhydrolase [Algisphaera agarilytica]MBB6430069.1 beta-glucanase (GH16 family) [Algisphaera agarilytica]